MTTETATKTGRLRVVVPESSWLRGLAADTPGLDLVEHRPGDEAADAVLIEPKRYEMLLAAEEDREAMAAYQVTRDEKTVPVGVVDAMLTGDSPVKAWRKHRKVTLSALAEKAGIGKGYLSQIENGHRIGTLDTRVRIAAALDVDLSDLV